MKNFDAKFLKADIINGVTEIDMVDYYDKDFMQFHDFKESLPYLEDGEVIYCSVGPEHFEEINEEYGVQYE